MPEDRPTPPPQLVDQSRDPDLRPYERQAASAELEIWYRQAYPEPSSDSHDYAPSPGAPASSALPGEAPRPDPQGGVPAPRAAPYIPAEIGGAEPLAAETRASLAAAAGSLGVPETEIGALAAEYRKLSAAEAPPAPEEVHAALVRWHGGRAGPILDAARQAVAEAVRRDPGLEDVAGVLGCSAYAITVLGLAAMERK